MHIPRKSRTPIGEFYAIAEDSEGSYVLPCVLDNLSESGALFVVEGELGIRERIVACPVKDDFDSLPALEDVRKHPKRLTGVVIRSNGNQYGVRFDSLFDADDSSVDGKAKLIDVKEDGLMLTVKVQGNQTVESAVRLQDALRLRTGKALFILLDFSGTSKFPPATISFLKPAIKKVIHGNRRIALINSRVLGSRFTSECPDSENLKHCTFEAEARKFFSDHPIRVLIVEDEEITRVLTLKSLEKMRLAGMAATTGEEGVEMAQKELPDLILMDIHLPGIDGLEAAKQIRSHPSTTSIPIIMLTSEGEMDFVERGLQIPVDDYVLKPFKPETIKKRIIKTFLREKE